MRVEVYRSIARLIDGMAGHSAEVVGGADDEHVGLKVDGAIVGPLVELFDERSRARPGERTGRKRMNIGMYGAKQQFIQRKDGSFNWGRAAALLIRYAESLNRGGAK
jgi:hypothetical protein